MNGYGIFLTIELARILGIIPKNLEYDLTWERGEALHQEFDASKFNDTHKGEYGCIENFLKDYRRKHASEIIPYATNELLTVYSVLKHYPIHVSAKAHNLLIEEDRIHYDGRQWLFFDSDNFYITQFAERNK